MKVVTNRIQIERCMNDFRRAMTSNATQIEENVGLAGRLLCHRIGDLDIWSAFYENQEPIINKYWNAFGIINQVLIACEINVPIQGYNRGLNAVITNHDDSYYICHKGTFRIGQSITKFEDFLDYYDQRRVVTVTGPDRKENQRLHIATLGTNEFQKDIAKFVRAAANFKETIKWF